MLETVDMPFQFDVKKTVCIPRCCETFDSFNHRVIELFLLKLGTPDKLVKLVKNCSWTLQIGKAQEKKNVERRVRQKCTQL